MALLAGVVAVSAPTVSPNFVVGKVEVINSGAEMIDIDEIFTGPPTTQITLDTRELTEEPSEYLIDDWAGFVEPPKSAQNTEEPRLVIDNIIDIEVDSVVNAVDTLEVSISTPPGDRLDSVESPMDDYTQEPPRSAPGPEDPLVNSAEIDGISAGNSDIKRWTPDELVEMMNEETDEYLDYRAGLVAPADWSTGVEINGTFMEDVT